MVKKVGGDAFIGVFGIWSNRVRKKNTLCKSTCPQTAALFCTGNRATAYCDIVRNKACTTVHVLQKLQPTIEYDSIMKKVYEQSYNEILYPHDIPQIQRLHVVIF